MSTEDLPPDEIERIRADQERVNREHFGHELLDSGGEERARRMNQMKLPRTLLAINTALRARHAQGLSVEVVEVSGEPLRDEHGKLFMRLRFTLDDGGTFKVDSDEASEFLRACEAQEAPAGEVH